MYTYIMEKIVYIHVFLPFSCPGPVLAKELILTARVLNGEEAKVAGLVNHVTSNDKTAEQRALEIADEILPNAPIALRLAKIAVNKAIEVSDDFPNDHIIVTIYFS